MKCQSERAAHLLELSFLGELDAGGLAELHGHLSGCDDCRRTYDRQVAVERLLEPDAGPLPAAHLELVGQAVMARVQEAAAAQAAATNRRVPFWRRWALALPAGAAVAAAAVAVVLLVAKPADDGFQARAGAERPVEGIRAFCIGEQSGGSAVRASVALGDGTPLRCWTSDALQFSYTTGEAALHLAIVSVPEGADGSVLSYTRGEATEPVAAHALDEPLPYSTRLAARHQVGKRVLLALFFDQPRSASEIEAAARAVASGEKPPAGVRVALRSALLLE